MTRAKRKNSPKSEKNKRLTKNKKIPTKPVVVKSSLSTNWINFIKTTQPGSVELKVTSQETVKPVRFFKKKPSKVVAIDCEMVADENGQDMLARVSVVDFNLICLYDKYVKPTAKVGDYRTRFSGIRAQDIENGIDFKQVQEEVKELLHNKFLVGHSLRNDLNVLKFGHHLKLIRDTSSFKPFREISDGKTPSLRKLCKHFLNETIQEGEHSSVQDATAAMKLYIKFRKTWEKSILSKNTSVSLPTIDF